MIYTVTLNPSLDYVIQAEELKLGKINRAISEAVYPGGKGINVSVVLANLGIKSKTLGFVAGFTGEELEKRLKQAGCMTEFIRLKEGMTRINVKIHSAVESEINGQGPVILEEAVKELLENIDCLQKGDILILAGSIPGTLSENIYEKIMQRMEGKGIRIIVDATKKLLLHTLKYHPFLIKPNHQELGELFGVTLTAEEEIITYAGQLQKMGAVNVLISMAEKGAILLAEDGMVYKHTCPKGNVVNSVGAGDSMVAGFLAGYLNTNNYEKALQLGIAAGSATAFLPWLAGKEEIVKLLQQPQEAYGL